MQEFAVAGLILDIVGAVVLASAVFLRTAERTRQEASSMIDYNVRLHLSLAQQTGDAQVGLALLVGGFFLQGLSALDLDSSSTWLEAGTIAAAAVVTTAVAVPIRHRCRRVQEQEALAEQ